MARRIQQPYRCPALGQLVRQLLFVPQDKRPEQVLRAELLHDQVETTIDYPFEFVSYRVTGFRSESKESPMIHGADLQHDLRLLIDALCRNAFVPPPQGEAVETPQQIAGRLGVSLKTVQRWRGEGLRWRWVRRGESNVKVMVVTASALRQFMEDHPGHVERAQRYTNIAPAERTRILRRARQLAESTTATFNRVATHLAARTHRSTEAIRQLLARHDRDHPDDPIFRGRPGPLTAKQRRVIARAAARGVRMSRLVARFRRPRATLYRTIRQQRLAELRRRAIPFKHVPIFDHPDAPRALLASEAREPATGKAHAVPTAIVRAIADLPEALRPPLLAPPMTEPNLRQRLVEVHYRRFLAAGLRDRVDRRSPAAGDLDAIESHLRRADQIERQVAAGCLRHVFTVARRHLMDEPGHAPHRILELLEQGLQTLDEAIGAFDPAHEHTFEAFLTWSLTRRFSAPQPTGGRAQRRTDPAALAARLATLMQGVAASREGMGAGLSIRKPSVVSDEPRP